MVVLSVTTAPSVMRATAESRSRIALNPATMVPVAIMPAIPNKSRKTLWIEMMVSLTPFFSGGLFANFFGGCFLMVQLVDTRYH